MYPWEIVGMYVSVCWFVNVSVHRERGTGTRDKKNDAYFQERKSIGFMRHRYRWQNAEREKTGSITAMLYKGTPPFPLS